MPHPALPLPPGGYITRDEFVDLAMICFLSSPQVRSEEPRTRLEHSIDGTETATLRLCRIYPQHVRGQGYEILFSGFGNELHHRRPENFVARTVFAAWPLTSGDVASLMARRADKMQLVSMAFYDRQLNLRIMVNVVDIEDLEMLELLTPRPAPEPEPEPLAEIEPAAPPVQQSAEEPESGLIGDGRVVVDAIQFAFDSDEILPDSAAARQVVAAFMSDRTGLTLLVVGHADGVGGFEYDLRLSRARASAVVDWLACRHGIARVRLRPAGAGPMSPITTNRTEEGRALNGRVELLDVIQ